MLETKKSRVLVDCGLIQGARHAEEKNYEPFAYEASSIDAVFVTHAHIDHIGRLPKLVKDGFRGKIFMTAPTCDFTKIMLEDSQELMADEAKREKRKPLYTKKDVLNALGFTACIEYDKEIEVTEDIRVRFRDAGHILGSAIVEVFISKQSTVDNQQRETRVVFSGDLGNPPVPLLRPTTLVKQADYVVMESTYGDRQHEDIDLRKNLLEDAIEDTVTRGGTLMIPSFAMERTQELLYELNSLAENHRIPEVPVFIDSPLAIKSTEIYRKYPGYFNKEATYLIESGDKIFQFPRLKFTLSTEESKAINDVPPPKVIIAGSGMSTGGRIMHHELRYLQDPNSTILFIGYQVAGTLGRRIFDGAKNVKIFGEEVSVNCEVRAIGGYSAHADQEQLRKWVKHIKEGGDLKKVFVVQGEEGPALALVQLLRDHLGIDAYAPMLGESIEL